MARNRQHAINVAVLRVDLTCKGTTARDQECAKRKCELPKRRIPKRCAIYTKGSNCETTQTAGDTSLQGLIVVFLFFFLGEDLHLVCL